MARKKKSTQKHQKDACEEEDDTSDEELKTFENVKTCSHIAKAVNLSRLKKAIKGSADVNKCKDCKEIRPLTVLGPSKEIGDEEIQLNEVWLCLQCGYHGCGRNSTEKHAERHYKTPRSDCHSIVLGLSSTSVWCYACEDVVQTDSSRNLKECYEFVMKQRDKVPNNVLMNGGDKKPLSKPTPPSENVEKTEKTSSLPKPKEVKESKKIVGSSKHNGPPISRTIKGLRNLGNTCFFNAVMQNLCQTPWLLSELERQVQKGYEWEVPYPIDEKLQNREIPKKFGLPDCLGLTQAFVNFLKQMNKPISQSSLKNDVLNPSSLFDQICKKSPQFCGFHQQDSHELLRQLLDGIRNEEIWRQKKAILNAFGIKSEEVDENTKQIVKSYGSFALHTIVERIFGGQLISTVVCEECKGSSQVFEPFMDLSLPLIEEKPARIGKLQKHEDDNDGMHCLPKKKESIGGLSKHQEKKRKELAKKASKKSGKGKSNSLQAKENTENKSAKSSTTKNSDSEQELQIDKKRESSPFQESTEDSQDAGKHTSEENQAKDRNLSEATKEMQNLSKSSTDEKKDSTESSVKNTEENNSTNGKNDQESNEELTDADVEDNADETLTTCNESVCDTKKDIILEELCNQITELRIRRDSDKQEDLLESIEEYHLSGKHRKSLLTSELSNTVEEEERDEDWAHSQSEGQAKEWILRSLTTLKARYQPDPKECSINSCLNQFTASELLTGSNKFLCKNCTKLSRERTGKNNESVYSNASKQLLIFSPPAILTLHLKRFQQTGMSLRKLNSFVKFPQILDLAPYCSSTCLRLPHMSDVQDEVLYSLYGIVQHSGRLTSGHYTAYVKLQELHANPAFLNNCPMGQYDLEQLLDKISKVKLPNGLPYKSPENTWYKWYYVSDSMFKEVSESEVMQCQAYILFYHRIK